jgi:hypothetical protein
MVCLLGSVKECDMFNSDDTAEDPAGYNFSHARQRTARRVCSARFGNLGVHILAGDSVGPARVEIHQKIFGLLV